MPPGERKSGMPAATEAPAPVRNTIRFAPRRIFVAVAISTANLLFAAMYDFINPSFGTINVL